MGFIGLDAVVWTNLPPKFNGEEGKVPIVEEVISFLKVQPPETKRRAELNWTSLSDI
jgi:hypothetical protein